MESRHAKSNPDKNESAHYKRGAQARVKDCHGDPGMASGLFDTV